MKNTFRRINYSDTKSDRKIKVKKRSKFRIPIHLLSVYFLLTISSIYSFGQASGSVRTGPDFSGKNLTDFNFTTFPKDSLVGANFQGAILNGAQFQNVNLSNADFSGAVMSPSAKGRTDLSGCNLNHTSFVEAKMDSINLQFAVLSATDFSKASLFFSDFGPIMTIRASDDTIRTKFNYTTTDFNHFPISNWPAEYWANTDLSYIRISGLTNKNFSFFKKNISWAILQGANFMYFDFRHATLTGVDFSHAILDFALMDSSTMDQVKLVEARLNNAQMNGVNYYNPANTGKGADFSGTVFNNSSMSYSNFTYANLQGASLNGISADNCNFNNVNFQSGNGYNVANFSGANLSNSTFSSAALNGVNMSNTYIVEGQFNDLTMLGTNFTGATMPNSTFQNSILEGVLFTGAILQETKFISTTLKTSPNSGSGVDLSCTQLGGADFSNAVITQADFSYAVMPTADSCCKILDGYHCGIIAINDLGYGGTVLPMLKSKVNCPNGDYAICNGEQWLVKNWRTANCNPQHVMETVWFKPNCGGSDTTGQISFADPNLQACIIDEVFNGDKSKIITKDIAAQVSSLSCPCRNISNLEGLQYFNTLRILDLSGNKLTDGTFFSKLHSLGTLKIEENQIVTLNLQGVTNINYVDASHNKLSSVLFDANAYLNFIDLSYNQLTNLDLSIQTDLNYMDLSHNKLSSVGDLSGLTVASSIYLQNNSLTEIGNISKLFDNGNGNLLYLLLSCNLPFKCNTLGLDNTAAEKDFLDHTDCGNNSLCNE